MKRRREIDEQRVDDIKRRMDEAGFEVVEPKFMRGKRFVKDDRTAERKLLDMPCSETIH